MAFSKLLTFSHFPQLLKIQPTAWFHNFHNARDIISRLGVEDNFQRWEVHDLMYKNYQPERMYSHGIFPLNLAGMVHCPLSLFLSLWFVFDNGRSLRSIEGPEGLDEKHHHKQIYLESEVTLSQQIQLNIFSSEEKRGFLFYFKKTGQKHYRFHGEYTLYNIVINTSNFA